MLDPEAMSQEAEMHWDRIAADVLPASPALPADQQGSVPLSPSTDVPGLGNDGSSPDEHMESGETVAAGKSSEESPSLPVTSGSFEGFANPSALRRVSSVVSM